MSSGSNTELADTVAQQTAEHDPEHPLNRSELARFVFVAIASAAVWFRVWEPFERGSVIVAAIIGMFPILEEAFEAVLDAG